MNETKDAMIYRYLDKDSVYDGHNMTAYLYIEKLARHLKSTTISTHD